VLRNKDIVTVEDALYFVPRTYEDRRQFTKIKDLHIGTRSTSFGEIARISTIPMRSRQRSMFIITISDGSGFINAKWFRYNKKYMEKKYQVGMRLVFTGDVKVYKHQKEMTHPDIEIIDVAAHDNLHVGRIVPIYSQTEGLHQKTIRKIMKNVVESSVAHLKDPLPKEIRQRHQLLDLKTSFREIHFPSSNQTLEALLSGNFEGRRRLVFDEFFYLELSLAMRRLTRTRDTTTAFPPSKTLKAQFLKLLPFELTDSQKTAISEIEANLNEKHPMNRLLQGDVGSGKTLVALLSALTVLEQGHQVAFMVPTEILAEQHFTNLGPLLAKVGIRAAILKSDMKKSDKTKLIQEIKMGYFQIVIGTHAIIENSVGFEKLGLVIIDEQHRFGVKQRLKLKEKGKSPHLLVMTATPIPRTLALTVYGDLDLSIMYELPKGRKPIHTKVVREAQRLKLYSFMKKELAKKRQAYVVYPLVEESEKVDLKDATQMTQHLKIIFKDFRVELIHGRMKSEEKNTIMNAFKENKINVLVSTTVIEVGIDVPNSTIMVVEHAERFGLSQLHQLRGRIGRGSEKSYCFLLAQHKSTDISRERLKAMEAHHSGFKIAEIDLKLRGPGEFLGRRQSGLAGFRIANLVADAPILIQARKEAFDLIKNDPTMSQPGNRPLKEALKVRLGEKMSMIGAG